MSVLHLSHVSSIAIAALLLIATPLLHRHCLVLAREDRTLRIVRIQADLIATRQNLRLIFICPQRGTNEQWGSNAW